MLHSLTPSRPTSLASIVESIATEDFHGETIQFVHTVSGAEHYALYRVRDDGFELVGGASTHGAHASLGRHPTDPDLRAASLAGAEMPGAVMVRVDPAATADPVLRRAFEHYAIVDRVILCGRRGDGQYAMSLLRSRSKGLFAERDLHRLSDAADGLLAACAKHTSMRRERPRAMTAFHSVEIIERQLREARWALPERELQVTARIVYGISSLGIALDLNLCENTVSTYRKRIYQRLRIGSRHELVQRYLTLV